MNYNILNKYLKLVIKMNPCILKRVINLPESRDTYNKVIKCVCFLKILYPNIILSEEGCDLIIFLYNFDKMDNFINTLCKLINYSNNLIINIVTVNGFFSIECQLNEDLIVVMKIYLK